MNYSAQNQAKKIEIASELELRKLNEKGDSIEILAEIIKLLWRARLKIVLTTGLFAIASVFYAISLPNVYKSTAVLVPTSDDSKGGLNALASQYGGLAAMAGINLGSPGGDKIEHAIELVKSWPYLEAFVEKHDLKPIVFASVGWDASKDEVKFDSELFDPVTNTWLDDEDGNNSEPSSFTTFLKISKQIHVMKDPDSGLVKASYSHYSPKVAERVVTLLVADINDYFKRKDKIEAQQSIEFLTKEIEETPNTEMRQVFFNLIESHSKTLMLAEVNEQYLVKTLIKPMIPEMKDKPGRAAICVLGTVLGIVLSAMFVVFSSFFASTRKA